jgi:heme-degrading monooxygenase HmoA
VHNGREAGIVRSWSARATREGADAYEVFFKTRLVPQLETIPGHRGALVLRRAAADLVEITVLTFWDSMDAIQRFAGETPNRAVVEDEARAVLVSFDELVRHDAIALDTVRR